MDYEKLIADLVKPLVLKPEEVQVITTSNEDNVISLQVLVNPDDLGRVIGRKGRIANSIRTLAFACAAREGKKIEIAIEERQ